MNTQELFYASIDSLGETLACVGMMYRDNYITKEKYIEYLKELETKAYAISDDNEVIRHITRIWKYL